ncbi:MAG TPA: hypothetical protein VM120_12490 [Bryobacteraceae bacterium]|nr:hypothetical protein [Bryobacteraceae bacterium]
MLLAGLLLQVISYSRDIAPQLAFHCNRCHGDEITAGGVDTRTYQALRRTTNFALMLELMEGRRGGSQRMPRDAPPLDAALIERFRQWLNAGTPFDREPSAEHVIRETSKTRVLRIEVRAPGRAYAVLEIANHAGSVLHREAAAIEGAHRWTLRSPGYWPPKLIVHAAVYFASGPAILVIRQK